MRITSEKESLGSRNIIINNTMYQLGAPRTAIALRLGRYDVKQTAESYAGEATNEKP